MEFGEYSGLDEMGANFQK